MTFRSRLLVTFFAVAITPVFSTKIQAQTPAPPTHPTSTPYTGDLSIFEKPGRDQRLQIDRVMDLLNLKAGGTVADIGAGSGWFSVRAARRVAPGGRVIAEDINTGWPEAVTHLRLPQNVACSFPALRSSEFDSQHGDSL